ncbi:MAG: cobalamin biosynthesis protein [Rhodobacteraceae bacterium]|nr:cobalamin biosynthesis protein [Paracoccaceae bacterium]
MSPGLLICAMLLDAALGEPRWLWSRLPHPAVLMGRAVKQLESWFYDASGNRRFGGTFAVVVLVAGAAGLGWALAQLGALVEIIVTAVLLAQKSLVQHVQAVGDALRLSVHDGRLMVARIVSRDTAAMTESQVARSAIESAAENLSDGVLAPAFWALIGGLPGLLIYKAVNTADSMIGYRTDRYAQFGWAAARLDDVLNLIPARMTGIILAALAHRLRDWSEISHDARRHRSPNAGWPEAAMARALSVALAGPRSYDGQMRQLAWVNEAGRKQIGAKDIDASVAMLWRSWAVMLGLVAFVGLLSLL